MFIGAGLYLVAVLYCLDIATHFDEDLSCVAVQGHVVPFSFQTSVITLKGCSELSLRVQSIPLTPLSLSKLPLTHHPAIPNLLPADAPGN